MMREILFRGRSKSYGVWTYGDLMQTPLRNYTAIATQTSSVLIDAVEPNTVGQYIGLKDIDGNKIFEGDIVDILTETEEHGYIKFEDSAFIVVADGFCVDFVNNLHGEDVRIIGNIYDNPEIIDKAREIKKLEEIKNEID